ncbi:MAG: dTDP-4-dehydrorhamnose reductase [Planctomycetota bacterium]|nr:MAG: dTDP-4-dehydrorhamnose reductase [Planctomycetota bacterium]
MRPDRVLILGSRGMLGRAWTGLLTAHGIPYDVLGRDRLDLEDLDAARSVDVASYSHLINCAAWTAVDDAETEYDRAHTANAEAVGVLARRCAEADTRFVTYSTDYVFSGVAESPYRTDHPREPVNAYGRSKAAGEVLLEQLGAAGAPWLCIRTSWVYAPWGRNFVRTIANAARTRPELRVVDDQRGRPTSAEGLARTSLGLLLADATGFAHATDGDECSWFEFACEIVRLARTGAEPAAVLPCGSDEYPRPAPRPAYSVLDISRTEALIGPMTPWQVALADVMRRLDPP